MDGEIVHVELPSRDFVRSAAFYERVFGWKSAGAQAGGHLSFEAPGGVHGSWIRDALAQAPGPVPFVAVADVDKTLAEALAQGGRILVQGLTLPNRGPFGLFADCDGNVIGVVLDGPGRPKASAPDRAAAGDHSGPSAIGRGATKSPPKGDAGARKPAAKSVTKKTPPRKR